MPRHEGSSGQEIADVIRAWQPRRLDPQQSEALAAAMPQVREWVAASAPLSVRAARRRLWATTRLAVWAHREIGTVDPAVVLHPHNVQHFVAHVCADRPAGWRRTARVALTRVGRAVNLPHWAPDAPSLGRCDVADPYSAHDERGFVLAAALPGRANRIARMWVVCAALGAGLRGPEIAGCGTDEIVAVGTDRLGVHIRGRNPRLVPLRAAYTDTARQVLAEAPSGSFLSGTSRQPAHQIAHRLIASGESLVLRRARSTWLTAHLRAGTPLWALRVIAGPVSADTLNALLGRIAADSPGEDAAAEGLRA